MTDAKPRSGLGLDRSLFAKAHSISPIFHIFWRVFMAGISLNIIDEKLVSDEFLDDPYPLLRQLQQEDPVYWSESIGGWIVTRYDDIVPTFRDVAHFSNYGRF